MPTGRWAIACRKRTARPAPNCAASCRGLGILRESGHEHFNGSLVIPIFDATGNIVQLYGRKLRDDLRPGTPKHLYLPRPQAGVFNAPALKASKEIILCEALIDALTFWCAGYRNVTSSYGVNGITDELLAAFKTHGTERVLIAFDRDEAGDKAAAELAPRLTAQGIECFRIVFPHGLDANAYARCVQPAAKSLGVAIRGAQWVSGKPVSSGHRKSHERPATDGRAGVSESDEASPGTAAPIPPSTPSALVPGWKRLPSRAVPRVEPEAGVPVSISSLAADSTAGTADAEAMITTQPEPQASAMPDGPSTDVPIEVRAHEILILLGDRRWRVRGLSPDPVPGQLKINLLVSRGDAFHVDTLDLYAARSRGAFLKQAAAELAYPEETLKRDLGAVLLKLEALQAEKASQVPAAPALTMTAEEKAEALALLRDPDLTGRIVADLTVCGIVGEDINKLVSYLACISRKQDKPLAVVIQSTSAAGKSAVMDAVLSLVPAEDRVHYSAMTGQSLFYMGEIGIKHKILAISEEAGVTEAAYALKLLQSQGELTIASTGKDPVSGRLVTQEYTVEGPVMLFLTTTAIEVDEELLNRCLVLTVNESREQTRAIHALQRSRRTLAGLLARAQGEALTRTHQNAQRLLRALPVVNPFAERLRFVDGAPRTRRDHEKYLSLIEAVTLLHQYQRPVKNVEHGGQALEYLEVTAADIALANRLARAVLGQSLDELPPQTRRLLHLIEGLVQAQMQANACMRTEVRFTRRDVREATSWGHTQLRVHLDRLVDMEYLIAHRGRQGAGFVYELAYGGEGRDGSPYLTGLIDLEGVPTTATSRGSDGDFAPHMRPGSGPMAGAPPPSAKPDANSVSDDFAGQLPERTSGAKPNGAGRSPAILPLVAVAN
jgi:hypothetical protein